MAHSMLGIPSETVFVECRAFVFYYNTNIRQWCDVGQTGIYSRVQFVCSRPPGSTGVYRIFARLETSGMITLNISLTPSIVYDVKDQTWHEIRVDPRSIYGLHINPESDANPGPVPSNHIQAGPPPAPKVVWGVHPNTPVTNAPVPPPVRNPPPGGPLNPEARRSQRRRDQEAQIDAQCLHLSTAVQNGNISQATEIVKTLTAQKLCLSIKLKNPVFVTMDSGEETINLKVVVEDKESSGGAFTIKVLPTATIERLQQEVFDRYGFPVQVQKWIVSKKIPKPQETLQELGVTQSGTTVFLYLLSGKSVGLRRSDAERLARRTATPVSFPVITESNTSNTTDRITPVTTATGISSLVEQNGALLAPSLEPLGNPSPPASVTVQRNVSSSATCSAFTMPRHISDIRNMLGQQMGSQAAVGHTVQNTVVNDLLSTEPVEQVATEYDEALGWQCPFCTLINPPTRPGCEACSAARPADYVVPTGTHVDERERNRIAEEQRSEALFREAERRRQEEEQAARDQNFVALLQTAQQSIIPNTEEFDCGICFVPVEPGQGVILRECLHSFCRECLSEHIRHATDPEVQCPHQEDDYACHAIITGQEIKALLSPEDFNKFLNRSLATAESQAVNSFHCKTPNCGGWCVYEDNVNTFYCPVCNQPNCLTCKAIHAEMNCREYQDDLKRRADNDDAAKQTQLFLEEMVKNGDAMHCPMCRIILLKKDGCDWMRCSMCRMEICWATRGPRWGPEGTGDISGGCKCRVGGKKCHPKCKNCH